MNGLAAKHFVSDCPLGTCHWASSPLETVEAALEARRAHVNGHTHGDLVEYIARMNTGVAEYERAAK